MQDFFNINPLNNCPTIPRIGLFSKYRIDKTKENDSDINHTSAFHKSYQKTDRDGWQKSVPASRYERIFVISGQTPLLMVGYGP